GYWSVNTATVSPSSGGVFSPLTPTPSSGSQTNIRVTAADKAGNTQVVTATAPVASSIYTLSNASVIEGTAGTRSLAFLVTRAGDLTGSATVNYGVDTINSTATIQGGAATLVNGDFSSSSGWGFTAAPSPATGPAPSIVSGALNFANSAANQGGYASQDVSLNAGQRYMVSWSQTGTPSISFGVTASGVTVLSDQTTSGSGTKSFSFTATSTGTATLKFTDNSTTTGAVTVDNVTLTSPAASYDYTGSTSGTVTFNAGETSKLISYTVNGDYYKEINDKLQINLSNPSTGSLAKSFGIGVIQEVDPTRMQAIYSLVDVNPNLVTYAIQVRRSSDGATADIGFDAYGQLDTAALLTFTGTTAISKGYVVKWYDQSGNGRDMAQTTAGSQGVIVNNGSVITRSDGTYGINFNTGQSSDGVNNDFMTAAGPAASNWTDAVISAKVQSTGTGNGSLFQIGPDGATPGNRLSSHYGETQTGGSYAFVFDVGAYTNNSSAGRLIGGVVDQGVANDIVFEAHINGPSSAATSSATNYAGAKQVIYKDGVEVAVDDTLPNVSGVNSFISTGSTWNLGRHDSAGYYQQMIVSEFSVFLDNTSTTADTYSTPVVKALRGSADNDVLTYGGEVGLTAIDGGAGYDVVYLQGGINLNPALLINGMSNIEQIWAQNGSSNIITLSDDVLLKNPAPLLINMDAGDRVVLNSATYNYNTTDTQTLLLGTTGNDTINATGANDHMVGRGGADTFVWQTNQTGTDRIDGFNQSTDKLDIAKLLQGYASGTVSSYVTISTDGIDTTVRVDLDGPGSNTAVQNIVLKDVQIYSTADQLVAISGTLKVL
ncbi:MAG: type I secretion C-terminal target domain-containing protein, partial [Limnohabitans sp.]|nr:type I secretion C-terminal target domain-containing protein [Limnohabitans sp.]